MKYIGGTKLDERIIRTDLDPGFQEGRQYGYVKALIALQFSADGITKTGQVRRASTGRVQRRV